MIKKIFLQKYKKKFEEIEDISEMHLLNKHCLVLNQRKQTNNLLQNKVR